MSVERVLFKKSSYAKWAKLKALLFFVAVALLAYDFYDAFRFLKMLEKSGLFISHLDPFWETRLSFMLFLAALSLWGSRWWSYVFAAIFAFYVTISAGREALWGYVKALEINRSIIEPAILRESLWFRPQQFIETILAILMLSIVLVTFCQNIKRNTSQVAG